MTAASSWPASACNTGDGAYFGVEDDDVYEGTERLVVIIERSPSLPSGLVQFVRPNGDTCEPHCLVHR